MTTPAMLPLAEASAETDAAAILRKADEYRNFKGKSFSFDLVLTNHGNKNGRKFNLSADIRDAHTSLVIYENPTSEKGKAMLMNGNNLWFYSPGIRKPLRITPQQRLVGEASNGDVASTDFSGDYNAELAGEEKLYNMDYYKLKLTAKPGHAAAYQMLYLWVRKSDFKPYKAQFYAPSGKPLKSAFYTKFEQIPRYSKEQLTELTIINALDKRKRTTMQYSNFEIKRFPETRFQPTSLSRLR